jgi:hypothetical protein
MLANWVRTLNSARERIQLFVNVVQSDTLLDRRKRRVSGQLTSLRLISEGRAPRGGILVCGHKKKMKTNLFRLPPKYI